MAFAWIAYSHTFPDEAPSEPTDKLERGYRVEFVCDAVCKGKKLGKAS